jgi:spore coat protein CotH
MDRKINCFAILILFGTLQCAFEKKETIKVNIEHADLISGMNLYIPDSSFNKIKEKREAALKKNLLVKSKSDYVSGYVLSNGKKIKVKARLKGDHVDHFEGDRWSFRIVTEKGKILNHKKISVQGVHTRAFLIEWVYHILLQEEGLINLQYEFFPFCVNDSLCGIYAFESHFDNYLLTRTGRKPGPIMKFDESDFWDDTNRQGKKNRDELLMVESSILIANKKWGKKNEAICEKAKSQLDDFRNGRKDCGEVFDLKLWAKFIAINEVMSGNHALRWHNLRFYFNPETEKIEPIGFDCGSWMERDIKLFHADSNPEKFHDLMFKNTEYISLIKEELVRLSAREYLESFFKNHNTEIREREMSIKKEKLNYRFWESAFYFSQERIIKLSKEQLFLNTETK